MGCRTQINKPTPETPRPAFKENEVRRLSWWSGGSDFALSLPRGQVQALAQRKPGRSIPETSGQPPRFRGCHLNPEKPTAGVSWFRHPSLPPPSAPGPSGSRAWQRPLGTDTPFPHDGLTFSHVSSGSWTLSACPHVPCCLGTGGWEGRGMTFRS